MSSVSLISDNQVYYIVWFDLHWQEYNLIILFLNLFRLTLKTKFCNNSAVSLTRMPVAEKKRHICEKAGSGN